MSVAGTEQIMALGDESYSRYGHYFTDLLAKNLPSYDEPVLALDLFCGTGDAAIALSKRLPLGSRVAAVSSNGAKLKVLHQKLVDDRHGDTPMAPGTIFPHRDDPLQLPIADNALDLIWLALPTRPQLCSGMDLRAALRQAVRLLKPGGTLMICAPLPGSFRELFAAVAAFDSGGNTVRRLLAQRIDLLDSDSWQAALRAAGVHDIIVTENRFSFTTTAPIIEDKLAAGQLLPLWYGTSEQNEISGLQVINAAVPDPLSISVRAGCFIAKKPAP